MVIIHFTVVQFDVWEGLGDRHRCTTISLVGDSCCQSKEFVGK